MKPWQLRSPEVANLLNPAFCGNIIYKAVESYSDAVARPMPYPLVFILLPLILYRAARESINPRRRAGFQVWLNENQQLKVGFAARARHLVPFAREAVTFLLQSGALNLTSDGGLAIAEPLHRVRRSFAIHSDDEDCLKKAVVLAKWLTAAGPAATVYVSLGVKP
jgi:hypothetical protein